MSVWNKLYHIGISSRDSAAMARRKKINNQVTLFTAAATFFFIPYLVLVDNYYFIPFEIAASCLIVSAFLFNHFGWLKISMYWRFVVVLADVTWAALEMPGAGFEYFLIPLGLIPFILSDNSRTQWTLIAIALSFFFMRMLLSVGYRSHSVLTRQQETVTYVVVLSMVFALCALFVLKFKAAGVKYEGVIRHQLHEIEEQKKDILDSITYAKRIQKALLPPSGEFQKLVKDHFIFYKPKDIVSGDFYWLEMQDNKVFVAVADCTGHGVPGAMMSMLCTNSLSRAVRELGVTTPSLILDKVEELMADQISRNNDHVRDGMDISLCCINFKNKSLEYSGAFNPLYRISGGAFHEIKADKQPIGKIDHRKPFTNHHMPLAEGDCFYLFSDGLSDQFGGPKGKKFTARQFQKLLVDHHIKPMKEQMEILSRSFDAWKGDLLQVDDVCVMGFRV
jgi:serine phosphatase RsbU (regulator of sigma subunit)